MLIRWSLFAISVLSSLYAECAGRDSVSWSPAVLHPAYNASAENKLKNPWHLKFWGDFLYWQAIQENMELGSIETSSTPSVSFIPHSVINMDFAFKPGFQIGIGGTVGPDDWDLQVQYTWFHNTNMQTATTPSGTMILPAWVVDVSVVGTYTSATEMWRLNMDIADFDLGRWYYSGTHLLLHPTFGIRAMWLEQDNKVTYLNTSASASIPKRVVMGSSRSWALGGKASVEAKWMLSSGWHLYGFGEGDLLFTDYVRLQARDANISPATNVATINDYVTQSDVYTIKPHVDLELGLGWGRFFNSGKRYVDLEVGYGFQVFFNQNMFRHYGDDVNAANGFMPNGNLYIQGLTAKVGFEF